MSKMTLAEILKAVEQTEGKRQHRIIFKRRRSNEILTREQVKYIKRGRKLLRKELKKKGVKGKEEFELMASKLGLYFDKGPRGLWWRWLFFGRGLWALLGALLALLLILFLYSLVTQMRGHFTINMSDEMFREGFVLSETEDFARPTTHLFCEPAVDVPCISIAQLPADLNDYEGQHNADYFAYSFFLRNEGESTVGYDWYINLNSESQNLTSAAWVMVFEDGEMQFYAKPTAIGAAEALPPFGDNSRGYINLPLMETGANRGNQYQVISQDERFTYYRVVPKNFVSEDTVATGNRQDVDPMEVHKYTIVIWLEGDDPDCTNDLIGGHVGMEMNMKLIHEEVDDKDSRWQKFWDNLEFWEDPPIDPFSMFSVER